MTRYYLTDDSCEPLDIGSLSITSTDEPNRNDCDWCYDSKEDLLANLKRQLKELEHFLCTQNQHDWIYGMTYSRCNRCNYICKCNFVGKRHETTKVCHHCGREELS